MTSQPIAGVGAIFSPSSATTMTRWNSDLETGHACIDAEHRELLTQLQALKDAVDQGAGRERIAELINILQTYVLGHFAREEAHMVKVNCPAADLNRAAHREFTQKLDGWLFLLSASGSPVSMLLDVHREACAWIESHILNCDCQLRRCRPD